MPEADETSVWRIGLEGWIDSGWFSWLDRVSLRYRRRSDGSWITTVTGRVRDQADLRGIVGRIWDLNLRLLFLNRLGGLGKGGNT